MIVKTPAFHHRARTVSSSFSIWLATGRYANNELVTSVGATQIKPGATVSEPEVAVIPGGGSFPEFFTPFTSGGGFSNVFSRPSYQNSAVASYLQIDTVQLPPSSTYNSTGRAFPDVSANGWNIATYLEGFTFF